MKIFRVSSSWQRLLRVSCLTSGVSSSFCDIGGGEDAAVLPVTLDIAKGVGDDVGAGLDDMAATREDRGEDRNGVKRRSCHRNRITRNHVIQSTRCENASRVQFPGIANEWMGKECVI
jgi:hypothetical protein